MLAGYDRAPWFPPSRAGLLTGGDYVRAGVGTIDEVLAPSYQFTAFVSWDQIIVILPVIFFTGIVIAMIAAGLTLRRYLKV